MRENRPSGSEGGVALIPPSLPLSNASRSRRRRGESRQRMEFGASLLLRDTGRGGIRPSTSTARPTTLLETANPPNEGMTPTPSGLGGTRSTASDGRTPFVASVGLGGTGPFMES